MIAYYDRLSTGNTIATESTADLQKHISKESGIENTSRNRLDDSKLISTLNKPSPPPLPTRPPPIHNLHKHFKRSQNFRALSANVQRLISHSNSTLDDTIMSHLDHSSSVLALNSSESASNTTETSNNIKRRSITNTTSTSANGLATATFTTGSRFKHPLSKNACKLTQVSNELINTIGTDDTENYCNQNVNIVEKFNEINYNDALGDTTPTNEESSELLLANLNLYENTSNASCTTTNGDNEGVVGKEDAANAIESSSGQQQPHEEKISSEFPSNDNTFLFTKSCFYAPREFTEGSRRSDKNSNGIDDAPTKPLPPPPRKQSKKSSTKSALDLPRLNTRPLSSTSICSSSSTSSSGSDAHSHSQTAISYLASVESLADQSENELIQLGNTLTVMERACLEIVDSERIYVDDLGQVIRG